MGMSSSQARLLSLTGRMHDIELKSQRIQAEKLRLANESNHVYEEYVNALEAKKLMAKMVDSNGQIGDVLMTGGKSLTFGSYLEQYAMLDKNGKTLVSESFHNSYSSTNSLAGFLEKEGVWVNGSHYEQILPAQVANPDYITATETFTTDFDNWNASVLKYQSDHNEWLWNMKLWQAAYDEWSVKNDAYQVYLGEYATYESNHNAWTNQVNAYNQYLIDYANWQSSASDWDSNKAAYDDYLNKKAIHDQWVNNYNAYQQYLADYANYETIHNAWVNSQNSGQSAYESAHAQWVIDYANWETAHAAWEAEEPVKEKVGDGSTQAWWSIDTSEHNLHAKFEEAAAGCYHNAETGTFSCYKHILSHIVDFSEGKGFIPSNNSYGGNYDNTWYSNNPFTTTTGDSYTNSSSYGSGYADYSAPKARATWAEISAFIDDEVNFVPKINPGETCDVTASSSQGKKLISKWNTDGSLKSLKQWAKDLLWVCINKSNSSGLSSIGITRDELSATVSQFHDSLGTCIENTEVFNQDVYNEYWNTWKSAEPTIYPEPQPPGATPEPQPPTEVANPGPEPENPTPVPDPGSRPVEPTYVAPPGPEPQPPPVVPDPGPAPIAPTEPTAPGPEPKLETYIAGIPQYFYNPPTEVEHTTLKDKAYAQWLINLWYKMQHEDKTATIYETTVHDALTDSDIVLYGVDNQLKKLTTTSTSEKYGTYENENYVVVPDTLLNNDEWLYNCVENGDVTLQVYSKLDEGFVNTSVAHSSTLSYQIDETYIKKAEAKYEADMRRINQKDAKYDQQLSICETERQAIKDEMETLKTVIKNNVEMNFKLFS